MMASSSLQKSSSPMAAANNLFLMFRTEEADRVHDSVLIDAITHLHDAEVLALKYEEVCKRLVWISRIVKSTETMEIWELRKALSDIGKVAKVE